MELILDTADVQEVKRLSELLQVTGVTTNPTIITKSGKTPEQVVDEMLSVLNDDQLFFMQVIAQDFEGMMRDARKIHALRAKNVLVKIPVTHAGLKAVKAAKQEGMRVLATTIYSADQGFFAAMNGADYLAPYVNRMQSFGDGLGQVKDLLQMLKLQNLPTKIVAASFKNPYQVHELIAAGIQAVTAPPSVVWDMLDHPGTTSAVDGFSEAWHAAYGRDEVL